MDKELWLVAVVGGMAGGMGWGLLLMGVAAWQERRRAARLAAEEAAALRVWRRLVETAMDESRAAGVDGYVRDVGPDRVNLN